MQSLLLLKCATLSMLHPQLVLHSSLHRNPYDWALAMHKQCKYRWVISQQDARDPVFMLRLDDVEEAIDVFNVLIAGGISKLHSNDHMAISHYFHTQAGAVRRSMNKRRSMGSPFLNS